MLSKTVNSGDFQVAQLVAVSYLLDVNDSCHSAKLARRLSEHKGLLTNANCAIIAAASISDVVNVYSRLRFMSLPKIKGTGIYIKCVCK